MEKNRNDLEEQIQLLKERLKQAEPGSEAERRLTQNLATLYETNKKLYLEEEKAGAAYEEMSSRIEKTEAEVEQMKDDKWFKIAGLGIPLLTTVITLIADNAWFNKGLKFEQTGSVSSGFFKSLLNSKMFRKK